MRLGAASVAPNYHVRARDAVGAERAELWKMMSEIFPPYVEYARPLETPSNSADPATDVNSPIQNRLAFERKTSWSRRTGEDLRNQLSYRNGCINWQENAGSLESGASTGFTTPASDPGSWRLGLRAQHAGACGETSLAPERPRP